MFYYFIKWVCHRMALNSMTSGNSERAEWWYKKYEAVDPDNIAVLHNLGVIYITLKRYQTAERYLAREIELFGDSDLRYRVLGDLYFSWGNREKASKAYSRSLSLIKKNNGNTSTTRFIRKRMQQCADSSSYKKAVSGSKIFEEGNRCQHEGNYNLALELYNEAVRYDSSNFMALNAAGTIMMNNFMRYDSAKKYFRKALDLADIPLIRRNLALVENKIMEKRNQP